jgi:hypothetical protein
VGLDELPAHLVREERLYLLVGGVLVGAEERRPLPDRVVRSDGGMGGYLGGVDAKRTLLTLEAA